MNYHYSVIVRFLFLIFFFGKGSVSQAAEGLVQCCVTNALPNPPRLQIGASGVFDATYPTNPGLKADILNVLNSSEGRASLKEISASKANQLLKRNDLRDLDKDEIVDAFLEYFKGSPNFNKIFKMQ